MDDREQTSIPIASLDDVKAFNKSERGDDEGGGRVPETIRCLVAEVALKNTLRYYWDVMKPVYHALIDECIEEYDEEGEEDETTERLGGVKSSVEEETEIIISKHVPGSRAFVEEKKKELHRLLDECRAGAPCTIQRLSEVVLFPKKQYKNVSKLLRSLWIILSVLSTHDTLEGGGLQNTMTREEWHSVNENPPSPYV